MTREHLEAFARTLTHDDHVVVEATGNATAVAEVLAPHVGRVVIANPRQVRLIAEARIKTDVIDATVLARLYASGFLPEVWVPDAAHTGVAAPGDPAQAGRPPAGAAQDDHPVDPARPSRAAVPARRPARAAGGGLGCWRSLSAG